MDEIVKIELFGEEFRFKPEQDQKYDPVKIATHVKEYINEAEELFQNKTSSKNKMAILLLAAMNLSKDYHELRMKYSDLEKDIESRISSLLEKIDKTMK
ncbi:cell division protein ZapA [uncultured Desulfobacter sp.]|uniref:cell division protein ZapA n=1 Tax=uncultured Desulfobacter sp. TaxID=240139 RepID=UPI002AAC0D0A|nr:cell division protein ZapA [uncultured Desulfobacter sp.]